MLGQVLHAHRLERSGADMQRKVGELHAALAQPGKQRLVEMKPGGRCGHRARRPRIHRLIARLVVGFRRVRDVRRQRQRAVALQHRKHVITVLEAQPVKLAVPLDHRRLDRIRQHQHAALARRMARANLREHVRGIEHALDQHLDSAPGFLGAGEPRLDHARIVEHHQVARRNQPDDVAKTAVGDGAAHAVKMQQAACGALGRGRLGDQLLRQFEIKIVESQLEMFATEDSFQYPLGGTRRTGGNREASLTNIRNSCSSLREPRVIRGWLLCFVPGDTG